MNRIEILLKYSSEDPDDVLTRYLLALEYIKEGNDEEARYWMENIYTQNSSYLPNYYHYGKLLERTGENEKAILVFRQGMSLARQEKDVHTYSELQGALEQLEE